MLEALSISKAFVKMLGGKIWVESIKEEGSIFYFTIPYNWEEKKINKIKQTVIADDSDFTIKKIKIIIAEDDNISAKLLTKSLEEFAEKIIRTKTGVETLEIFRSNPDVDLILMDIQMPEMNGHETVQEIRKFNKDI